MYRGKGYTVVSRWGREFLSLGGSIASCLFACIRIFAEGLLFNCSIDGCGDGHVSLCALCVCCPVAELLEEGCCPFSCILRIIDALFCHDEAEEIILFHQLFLQMSLLMQE